MTKLLISASELQDVLKRNPDVEVELVKNAAVERKVAAVFAAAAKMK